jgi:hypothetical protein
LTFYELIIIGLTKFPGKSHNGKLSMKVLIRFHPLLFFLLFILIFFGKKLSPIGGNLIGSFDLELHFWNLRFIQEQLLSGNIPFWNPYYYCGQPFLANPVTAVFYPSTLLFLILPFPWAFNIDVLFHILLAGTGMYLFVFHLTQSKQAGITAATIYCLNGYLVTRISAGHINLYHSASLIPWIFLCIENYYHRKQIVFMLLVGGTLGLQILSGDAQTGYYTGLAVTVYFFTKYFLCPESFQLKTALKLSFIYMIIPLSAICIGAIQMIPSLEFISQCQRTGSSFDYATYQSFPPENFFTFLICNPKGSLLNNNGEFAGYTGILSILIAAVGAFFSKHRSSKICFGIISLISISIILGHYTPLYKFYYNYLPLISSFRIPSRCLIIVIFCIAIFAGFGVQHISESSLTKKQNTIITAIAILFLSIILTVSIFYKINYLSPEIIIAICYIICGIILLVAIRFTEKQYYFSIFLILFLYSDLYIAHSNKILTTNQNNIQKERLFEKLLKNRTGYSRIMVPLIWYDTSRGREYNFFHANGNASVVTQDLYKFIHEMGNVSLPEFDTHTFHSDLFQKDRIFSSKIMGIKYGILIDESKTGEGQLVTASMVMPRAILVKNAIVVPALSDQLAVIKEKTFNPFQTLLLQTPVDGDNYSQLIPEKTLKKNYVTITQYEPNRIILDAYSNSSTYLVLSELFYPGWHAFVDGEEVQIHRANYLLRAIPLKAGKHKIVFAFEQRYFFIGACISILGVIFIVTLLVLTFQKENPFWKKL